MKRVITTALGLCLALTLIAGPLAAATRYVLDPEGSNVDFYYRFSGNEVQGTIPVTSTELFLDFQNVTNSRVSVTLDVTGARAGFVFATQAMKGPTVLDAENHPEIRFQATRFLQSGNIALVSGQLTLHGVTRPITLRAQLFRAQGTQDQDFSRLVVRMTGALSRQAFNATGYKDLVGDEIRLDITAALTQSSLTQSN